MSRIVCGLIVGALCAVPLAALAQEDRKLPEDFMETASVCDRVYFQLGSTDALLNAMDDGKVNADWATTHDLAAWRSKLTEAGHADNHHMEDCRAESDLAAQLAATAPGEDEAAAAARAAALQEKLAAAVAASATSRKDNAALLHLVEQGHELWSALLADPQARPGLSPAPETETEAPETGPETNGE